MIVARDPMDEIDQIATRYAAAVYAKDVAAFVQLYAPDVVVFDMWGRWVYRGRDDWAAMVGGWFGSLGDERVGVAFSPVAKIVSGDGASVAAIIRYAGLDAAGAELRAMENRISWMLERRDGRWLIAHEHSSAPADFETQKISLVRGEAD